MADLLNEVRLLEFNGWSKGRDHHVDDAAPCMPEPLLSSGVQSGPSIQSSNGASHQGDSTGPAAAQQVPQPELLQQDAAESSNSAAQAASSYSYSVNSVFNSSAAAAVAAYRRQYLGLEGTAPVSSASANAAGQLRPMFTLRSRPQGKLSADAGLPFPPGYLPRPPLGSIQQQPDVTNLPAKPGIGSSLPPARMQQRSCCPPPFAEPLVQMHPAAAEIVAERQAQRGLNPDSLINRLVYDSLLPPSSADLDSELDSVLGGCSSFGSKISSSRTTRSTGSEQSSRSNSTISETAANAVASTWQGRGGGSEGSKNVDMQHYALGLSSWYTTQGPDDKTLVFESRFECGNLRRVVQVQPYEYDLILQPDINTRGHTQWYYFAVTNMRAGQAYRFNIINFMKEDSLYNMGMLPLVHSERQLQEKDIGWFRSGSDVSYGPNNIRRKKQVYYTLTFVMRFPYEDDWVHLAHCYPYSYTDLQHHLHTIVKSPSPGFLVERSCLATSLAGNAVDVLTITAAPQDGRPLDQRQGIVLSARVHPGETNASWMIKGALQQLLGTSDESRRLRENFVFKVVPMLNPDGVIVGNYRCSLAGLDLNRVWQEPDARIQPVITAYKSMIKSLMAEREVAMFCDLHGHSRKYGIFIYGCDKKAGKDATPQAAGWPVPGTIGGLPGIPTKCQSNIFPLMLYINAPDLFSYRSCSFKVQKSKAGTGRVVGFRELGLVNAFTMEASFCGATVGRYAGQHFNTGHLEDMGSALVRTLLDYWASSEVNSAAELAAQLTGSRSSTAAAPGQSLAGLLSELGAASDEDSCTDSDDESSDDDLPAASPSAAHEQPAAAGDSLSAAAAAAAARISSSIAQTSAQLVALLSQSTGVRSADPGSVGQTVTTGASAAAHLLLALKRSNAAIPASGTALMGLLTSDAAGCRKTSGNGAAEQQQQAAVQPKELQASSSMAAADAARDLLSRLAAAKARMQCLSSTAMNTSSASTASQSAASNGYDSTAPCRSRLKGVTTADPSDNNTPPPGCQAASDGPNCSTMGSKQLGSSSATFVASQQQQQQHVPEPAQEDAILAATPGLIELLQQLVDDQAALNAVVATACRKPKSQKGGKKKKGRRRPFARYGNPEVLRAARAKADATLAAALPELGQACGIDDDAAEESVDDDDAEDDVDGASNSSNCIGALCAPVSAGSDGSCEGTAVKLIAAGRRANTARPANASVLDADRYMALLDKEKRHTGGVLAYSVVDNQSMWAQGSASCNSTFSSNSGLLLSYGVGDSATHREHCSTASAKATLTLTRSSSLSKLDVVPGAELSRQSASMHSGSLQHVTVVGAGIAGAVTTGSCRLGYRRQSKSAS